MRNIVPDSGIVAMDGNMAFYWNRLLEPSDFEGTEKPEISGFVPFPDTWNNFEFDGENLPGKGHATYRTWFTVDSVRPMAIKMDDYCNAFRLWINGKLIAHGGKPGNKEGANQAVKVNVTESFVPLKGRNELILQTANYEEKYGGFRQPMLLGSETEIRSMANRDKEINAFLLGLILMMALYHLALFGMNQGQKSFLWFGLMAFSIALRQALLADFAIIQPWFQEHVHFYLKLSIVSALMTSVFLFFFFHSVFPNLLGTKVRNWYVGIVLSMVPLAFTLPIYTVSSGVHYVQFVVMAGLVYIFYLTIKSFFSEPRYQWMKSAGVLLFLFSVVWEAFIFNRAVYSEYTLHYGLLGFILFQSFALSYDFSRIYRKNMELTVSLDRHNKNLKKKVEEKSREVVEAKERELLTVVTQKTAADQLLKTIEERVHALSKHNNGDDNTRLNEILNLIRSSLRRGESDQFLLHFTKINPDFTEILKELYPAISQRELKLCAYLRMNLNNNEIAGLLHVAPESVRKAKTRMRKKMGLNSDRGLQDYLMRI